MRIIVISMFMDGFGGGCGRVAHDMAQHFAAEHEVMLICPAEGTSLHEDKSGLHVLGIQSAGQGHTCVPILSRKNVNAMYDWMDAFAPDVVHAHEPVLLGLIGQIWAAMNNVPFVYTAHVLPSKTLGFGASDTLKFLSKPWTESITRRVMGDFIQHCDAVIALNRSAATDIAQFGYQGKLFMIPNGRDVDRLGTCPVADVTSPTKVLTFVGFVSQRKNQRYLFEVLQHLPRNYVLQIVGDVLDPEYGAQIKEWAKVNGLDNVVFTGPMPYPNIPDILAKTHVFVSASTMEVQSLAVIEALASGTPVVGLSNETVDELVDESVGSWLDQDASSEVFAQRVRGVCELPNAEYAQLCANARRRVAYLDWPQVRAQTVDAYTTLLDGRDEADAPSESSAEAQIAKIVARIPSAEVREIVFERLVRLNQTVQERMHPHSRLGVLAMAAHSKQVSSTTWLYVGATRAASSLLSGVSRLASIPTKR